MVDEARESNQKIICFVTGVPGAGKTLVGLNIANQRRDDKIVTHAVFLSGNGPLVAVLREALTRDGVARRKRFGQKIRKGIVASEVKAFIQNVHHFRDEAISDPAPPIEHVVIFDEAQRAWDIPQTARFMKRKKGRDGFSMSEAEFLISCMDRHKDWAVVICLVGGGQEINTGEAGIGEWLAAANRSFPHWHVYLSSQLNDSEYAAGKALEMVEGKKTTHVEDRLHLSVSMRSFRAQNVSLFVKKLLDRTKDECRVVLQECKGKFPIVVTRDLAVAKAWVRSRARGSERFGILSSSRAQRLKPYAIDIRVNVDPVHWFLNGKEDTRSSYYLEDAATEFQVQGLELDWACVTWDADMRCDADDWRYHDFRGDRWTNIANLENRNYLRNAYRVLLTRARQGMVIFVPPGDMSESISLTWAWMCWHKRRRRGNWKLPPDLKTALSWYEDHAKELAVQYESLDPDNLNAWLVDLLPSGEGVVLDVGAGTGRDAAWLASRDLAVVAVEPSTAMREEAHRLHADARIQWINDSLPDFRQASRLGLTFDFILLSAVWMHIPENDRARSFRKLITLLKPGGVIAMTLRQGPAEDDRGIYPVSEQEIERLIREHGAFIERRHEKRDALGRSEVTWIQIAIRLPDDGSGALPLLRHIILNDDKSSTYKLGLLRALCRVADGAAGYARHDDDECVSVPLGLVGLYWIRLYKPLLAANLPQSPINRGVERLGFVNDGFRYLMQPGTEVSHLDLRVGTIFSNARAKGLHQALRDACKTIEKMPAHFMTYPNGGPILPVRREGRLLQPNNVILSAEYLWSFGELRVPSHLWRALQRFDVWVEPALVAEWARLMKFYGEKQGRILADGVIANAMTWSEPGRDVRVARDLALRVIEGPGLRCVWTGSTLSAESVDIDHCLPWVAWPCGDLWNLLPTLRSVNQNQKRDRLPGDAILQRAQDRIQQWWEYAYLNPENPALRERFQTEARASLPIVAGDQFQLDDVFAGLALQRLRLKHDQQVPEWMG